MCRKFSRESQGGVLTPLTPPLDPPLVWYYRRYDIFGSVHESYFEHNLG